MYYMNVVEEGWRGDGWYQIDGAEDLSANNDTDWYYFKDGKAKKADKTKPADNSGLTDDGAPVYVQRLRLKVNTLRSMKRVRCRLVYSTSMEIPTILIATVI